MGRRTKLIAAFLIMIFCFSAGTLSLLAVDDYQSQVGDNSSQIIQTDPYVETDPPVVTEAPVETDPYVPPTDPPVATDPYYPGNVDDNSNNSDNNNSNNDSNSQADNNVQETPTQPVSVAPSASLYNSDGNIDDKVLSNSDWDDIAANLKKSGKSDQDSDSFDFIKKNESTNDNGEWMLIVGIVCLLLSAAGIAYIVASAVLRRKNLKNGGHGGHSSGGGSNGKRPAYASAGAASAAQSKHEYRDGYRQPSKNDKKQVEKRRKFDTAEVRIPKNQQNGGRYRSGSGKRYK